MIEKYSYKSNMSIMKIPLVKYIMLDIIELEFKLTRRNTLKLIPYII